MSEDARELLRRYRDHLGVRYSERTAPEYLAHVRAFLAWVEARSLTVAGLNRRDLATYQAELFALLDEPRTNGLFRVRPDLTDFTLDVHFGGSAYQVSGANAGLLVAVERRDATPGTTDRV